MKKLFAIVLAIVAASCFCRYTCISAAEIPELENVRAYVLAEASTGTVIDSKNADIRLNAGYLSKLMTILLVARDIENGRIGTRDELTASQNVKDTKGAVVWLEPGDEMTVDELLRSVIVGNANDAVTVLAEASSGSVDDFVKEMNAAAFDMGLRDTAFFSPYGYYDEREYTTARDMAAICAELAKYDFLRGYFGIWRDHVRSGRTELVSENKLSRTYDEHIGFKACHSEEAGYCIAEAGEDDGGNRYISVIFGAYDEDTMYSGTKKLLKSGFSGYKVTGTMFPDEMLMPVRVRNGCDNAVEICLRTQNRVVIPKGVSELGTAVVIPEYLTAPVKKGQAVGTAAFYSEKKLVCEIDIIAKENVEKLSLGYIIKKSLYDLVK